MECICDIVDFILDAFNPLPPLLPFLMLNQSQNPYGYRNLLAFRKSELVLEKCLELTRVFPHTKTLYDLADQMNRSARSVKQNICEGWKRNMLHEYYQFLGYAVASNAELEEDCTDIWKGYYEELKGLKGVTGEKGEAGEKGSEKEVTERLGEKGVRGEKGDEIGDIEKLKFYPLDETLPPVVQLKLRAKEVNFLLHRLQEGLAEKMKTEHTLPARDRLARARQQEKEAEEWLKEETRKNSPDLYKKYYENKWD